MDSSDRAFCNDRNSRVLGLSCKARFAIKNHRISLGVTFTSPILISRMMSSGAGSGQLSNYHLASVGERLSPVSADNHAGGMLFRHPERTGVNCMRGSGRLYRIDPACDSVQHSLRPISSRTRWNAQPGTLNLPNAILLGSHWACAAF
jgi:hypothetical protein